MKLNIENHLGMVPHKPFIYLSMNYDKIRNIAETNDIIKFIKIFDELSDLRPTCGSL